VRHPRRSLSGTVAVIGVFTGREEGFPRNPRGIVDPRLLGFGIAARGSALLDDVAAGLVKAGVDFPEFIGILDLNAEVIEARLPRTTPNRIRSIAAGLRPPCECEGAS
jgi:hypothetical protein